MNGQQLAPMCVGFAVAVVLFLVIGYFLRKRNMTAHLVPVKRELKKEKQWLRRGEYNAAMVKGRQNLELFLKLVAEFNGIELDNSAQAMANARSGPDGRGQRETYRMNGRKRQRVMTFQQFGWWLDENGYLDRVGKWELNEIRVIGNKAVHENYVSKEDAYNQYNYMEDLLKIVSDRHANRHRQRGPEIRKSQTGRRGAGVKKADGSGTQAKGRGQQEQSRGQSKAQGRSQERTGQSQGKTGNKGKTGRGQIKESGQNQPEGSQSKNSSQTQKRDGGKQPASKKGQNSRPNGSKRPVEKPVTGTPDMIRKPVENTENAPIEKLSSSAKRRQRRKRAKAAREAAGAAETKRENTQQNAVKQTEKRQPGAEKKAVKRDETRQVPQKARTERQVPHQTGMRIVTLSQTSNERLPQEKVSAKQTQSRNAAKRGTGHRRRSGRRSETENTGKNVERNAERAASGGGDHEK